MNEEQPLKKIKVMEENLKNTLIEMGYHPKVAVLDHWANFEEIIKRALDATNSKGIQEAVEW
jgi:hypothetical protein